jgi:DNA-binding SARP family transcriptional activator
MGDELAVVVIHREGRWMKLPDGKFVDMKAHRALSNIVLALAAERIAVPNAAVPAERLVQSGWPGESILPKAARNRLSVALSTLRKLGLADAIIKTEKGYMLNPSITLRVEAA